MDIQLDYTSSTSAAPAAFKTALQYAATQLDALITNNITLSISVTWDTSVFAEGGFSGYYDSYASVAAALKSHASTPTAIEAASHLPTTDPYASELVLSNAQAQALGFATGSYGPGADGAVTFGADASQLDFSTTNFAVSGEYDFIGVAEHELTHALGRTTNGNDNPSYIMDLYRYASNGTLQTNGASTTYFSIDGGATALDTFATSSDYGDWSTSATADSFDATSYPDVANTISSADTILLGALGFDIACFTAGTHIATPVGEVAVEALAIGDLVTTKFSGPQPIKWIGVSHYDGAFINRNPNLLPIRLKAHAIGPGIPARDLIVSPTHAICFDLELVHARRLVNGVSITQADRVDRITYYHIELATHDILFAEGCPAESFLDEDCRAQFHNAAEFSHLYPGAHEPGPPCLPRLEQGFRLADIQRRLNIRAGLVPAPEPTGPLRGYIDIAGPTRVAGWAQCATAPDHPVTLDVVIDGQPIARILANQYRADLRQAGLGAGAHGFDFLLPPHLSAAPIEVRRAADQAPLMPTEAATTQAA